MNIVIIICVPIDILYDIHMCLILFCGTFPSVIYTSKKELQQDELKWPQYFGLSFLRGRF